MNPESYRKNKGKEPVIINLDSEEDDAHTYISNNNGFKVKQEAVQP